MPQKPASNCRVKLSVDDRGRPVRCPGKGNRSGYCAKHYKQWRKAAARCEYPGCTNILTRPGHSPKSKRIRGRRMKWSDGKTYALCRRHEVLHLRLSSDVQSINLSRLGQGAEAGGVDGQCWIWIDGVAKRTNEGYGRFVPEGGDNQFWPAHRVSWSLLNATGWGHTQGQELAHRCNVRACINPAHLDPATPCGNARDKGKKARGPSRRYWGPAAHNFAVKYGLPNPFPVPLDNPWSDGLLVEPVTEYGMQLLQGK